VLTVPQQPVLPLDSSKSPAAYAACPWTRTGTAACAAFGRACPTAAYAASGLVCPTAAFAACGLTRTATAIPSIYSFSGNSAALAPISTFMCL
jgi:hypothetical protein